MSFWSRYDPVSMVRGSNTDNWAKLRVKSTTYRVTPGGHGVNIKPEVLTDPKTTWQNPGARVQVKHGEVKQLANRNFEDLLHDSLHGNFPGSYDKTRPSNNLSRSKMSSCFNERARDGFRYWPMGRPKPTSFGKYGIGSYKTVLGVGNAPRT
ncbi:hypothetical protein ScPMuIL_008114 [Solemya velum]